MATHGRISGKWRLFFIFAVTMVMVGSVAMAGNLTTFEEYAAMTPEHKNSLRAYVFEILYRDAYSREDDQQVECLKLTYSSGPEEDVRNAHARLLGFLDAGIEIHDEESRVEYAIANHMMKFCPRSTEVAEH